MFCNALQCDHYHDLIIWSCSDLPRVCLSREINGFPMLWLTGFCVAKRWWRWCCCCCWGVMQPLLAKPETEEMRQMGQLTWDNILWFMVDFVCKTSSLRAVLLQSTPDSFHRPRPRGLCVSLSGLISSRSGLSCVIYGRSWEGRCVLWL